MTFQDECREKFARSARRLVRFLDMNAPWSIVASETALLVRLAEGAFGDELHREILEHQLEVLRDRMGYCQAPCENRIAAALTHPSTCEHCDARAEAEFGGEPS